MIDVPQIESVSRLSRDYVNIIAMLDAGPVFLTQYGKGLAALVSLEQWKRIAARLEELQDLVDLLEAELALATGEDHLVDADMDKLKRMAHREPVPA